MTVALVLAGFGLLLLGGEGVVRGATSLASRLGMSPLVVGIAIVGFGTSLPELAVCIDAAINGSPGLAVGNVIGSNIANAMMILGLTAVVCPVVVDRLALRRDATALLCATLAFTGIGAFAGRIEWWHGALMIVVLGVYITWSVHRDTDLSSLPGLRGPGRAVMSFTLLAGGLAAVLVGAECLVRGAVRLATEFGVGEEVIGLTLIAVGTSLPEIATSLAAARRGHTELCLGNLIGSNLFNILGIAAVTALFSPLPVAGGIVGFDLWVLLFTSALMVLVMMTSRRIGRRIGLLLCTAYGAYIAAHVAIAP